MFADFVAAQYGQFRRRVTAAEKFKFSLESVLSIAGIDAEKTAAFFRLPYPECWFECPHGSGEIGFLTFSGDEPGHFRADAFFTADGRAILQPITIEVDKFGGDGTFSAHTKPVPGFDSDWLAQFVVTNLQVLVVALNTKNFLEIERVDKTEHNRKRERRGNPPLFSHHVCTVARRAARTENGLAGAGDAAGRRAHAARGHFRHMPDSLVWVRDHWRGNPALGFVTKDYRV